MPSAFRCFIVMFLLVPGSAGAGQLPTGFAYLRDVAPDILQEMRYAGPDNFIGKPVPGYEAAECILQAAVAEALKRVQADLRPQDLGLKVYDCYRPARATTAFLQWMVRASGPLYARHHPRVDRRRLRSLGYISASSTHSRGLSVDLTLVRVPPRRSPLLMARQTTVHAPPTWLSARLTTQWTWAPGSIASTSWRTRTPRCRPSRDRHECYFAGSC